jgi:hypothetical protein
MLIVWRGELDLCDQIWLEVGLVFLLFMLLWMELGELKIAMTPPIRFEFQAIFCYPGVLWWSPFWPGRTSEGRGQIHGANRASSRWWGAFLL